MTNTNNSTNLKLIETFYDKAKTIIKERYYIDENGFRQGMYEEFYENGKLKTKCTFKDDKMESLSDHFYKNDQIEIHALFELFKEYSRYCKKMHL
jgi:antitoxin component YwqK of YwqJK toxin-antitoxin module